MKTRIVIFLLWLPSVLSAQTLSLFEECGTDALDDTEKELNPWYGNPDFLDSIKNSYGLGLKTYQIQQLKIQK